LILRVPQRLALLVAVVVAALALGAGNAFAAPGDPMITVPINDSTAGVTYQQTFDLAFSGTTPDGTPVYIYVPDGGIGAVEGIQSLDPQFDPNPDDEFEPCASTPDADYLISQAQINALGNELTSSNPDDPGIVYVDEQHYGEMGGSEALVVLVYNIQDDSYYDCAETTYTAGYFAPDYLTSTGMNVIVIDAYDWANRVGDQADNPEGVPFLVEGVIAHELEHLLMNYSDPGELSWVDEGLADMAIFLNAYPAGGSHVAYHQVFHRETSLTRWGGGLENYGASFTWFLYLWEQAGGNGLDDEDPRYAPDQNYDSTGGDLLIKLIFEHADDGMAGIQAAINEFNAMGHPGLEQPLRSAEELFEDWVIAVYRDDEGSARFDIKNLDFGDPDDSWGYTIDIANDFFWKNRGIYGGATPSGKFEHSPHVPGQVALPFGTSYEIFRNPGPTFSVTFDGEDTTQIAPHTGSQHWWAGYESQADNVLNVDGASGDLSGATIDFWTWYFIEEGWDYGYVEALVNGEWVTVPLFNDAGTDVTTDTNPHDNNTEGNGLTGTSGGQYFVDEPQYIHLTGTLPAGTTDVRFRYSTDAAYLDTGWFVDDVSINGTSVDGLLSSPADEWQLTTGTQTNNWLVQILSPCDLSPGVETPGESVVDGFYLYRLGDDFNLTGLSSRCLGNKGTFTVVISNMPTGDLTFLDADYIFRVTNTANGGK
jgi:hypothetical protein